MVYITRKVNDMKIKIVYLSSDTKNLMYYEVIYIYRHTIQKYYFKIRFNKILILVRNKNTKETKIYIYSDNWKYEI